MDPDSHELAFFIVAGIRSSVWPAMRPGPESRSGFPEGHLPRPVRDAGRGSGGRHNHSLLRRVRVTTTSRNPALHFFLLGVGLILTNAWVFLRWEIARLLSLGPQRVDETRSRLHRFSRLLLRSIEDLYGTITAIPTHQSPQSVI